MLIPQLGGNGLSWKNKINHSKENNLESMKSRKKMNELNAMLQNLKGDQDGLGD